MSVEISNFRLTEVIGDNPLNLRYNALVDVTTTNFFFFKKTEEKKVHKVFAGAWIFVDTGDFTPGFQVEKLEQKLEAEKGKELQYCLD